MSEIKYIERDPLYVVAPSTVSQATKRAGKIIVWSSISGKSVSVITFMLAASLLGAKLVKSRLFYFSRSKQNTFRSKIAFTIC